jgi:hypothetical protein
MRKVVRHDQQSTIGKSDERRRIWQNSGNLAVAISCSLVRDHGYLALRWKFSNFVSATL